MTFKSISLDQFAETFSATTELSSVALGGRIVAVSDEFFAEAFHLLLVEPAPSMKGQFGPNGALYSGWETRRHNQDYDWCIIQLGTTGTVVGFDIDTSNFNGNEAPEVSVEALYATDGDPQHKDSRWNEILPRTPLGPSSRHLFSITQTERVNYVKLNMYPDGGIARFRVYGHVTPVYPSDRSFDLAHVFAGGRVDFVSDQHFGVGANLILPGRGKNMGDGWETKRTRVKGHKDWVIIKLGATGYLEHVEIDTAHFKGNFPEGFELHALFSDHEIDWEAQRDEELEWTLILPRTKLGPHRQHYFQLENVEGRKFTHVKATIFPDGGLKRVRIIGRRADTSTTSTTSEPSVGSMKTNLSATPKASDSLQTKLSQTAVFPVLPLTPEAFAPFGHVLQAYGDHNAKPKGTRITPANDGTASKFHKLALLSSSYPANSGATTGISIYRCKPLEGIAADGTVNLTALERHPYTEQAFIPMGRGPGEGLSETADRYLVVVARNGEDDRPDLRTVRAFMATTAQGLVYNTAVWHQPMTVLGKSLDLACVETQIGDGSRLDCEVVRVEGIRLQIE